MGLFTSRIRRGFACKTSPDSALSILCTLSPNLEVPSEIRSQHKLCNEAHKSTVYSLLPQLSLLERAVFLENASPLGRRWLATLPTQPLLRLTNFEVAANLMIRSLIPGMHANPPVQPAALHWPPRDLRESLPPRACWPPRPGQIGACRSPEDSPGHHSGSGAQIPLSDLIPGNSKPPRRNDRLTGSAASGTHSWLGTVITVTIMILGAYPLLIHPVTWANLLDLAELRPSPSAFPTH